ncbi:MAG: asparagine synthetase A [Desulfurococcaceae archaeon]
MDIFEPRKIKLISWIKHINENEFLIWDTKKAIKLKMKCNAKSLESLPCGSLVEIYGYIDNGEMCVENIKVVHVPARGEVACIESVPEDPVEYTINYPLYVRHPSITRNILVYFYTVEYTRRFLLKKGFIELPTVVVGVSSDPGLRGASKIPVEIYGRIFELQSSMIMYKQLYASIFNRVFYTARNIRLEPVENTSSGRHLVEFTQVDIECADCGKDHVVEIAEKTLYTVVKRIISKHSELFPDKEIERLEREIIKPPYPKLTYDEALREARSMGFDVKPGQELSFDAEVSLVNKYGVPVWVEGFPVESRGFYYIENPEKKGYNLDYNLLLPGLGEVLDGGCREYRYSQVLERIIKRHREDPAKYKWFLELLEAGLIRPTCGWGMGVERLVKYLCNLKHIAYATPHPRLPGVIGP